MAFKPMRCEIYLAKRLANRCIEARKCNADDMWGLVALVILIGGAFDASREAFALSRRVADRSKGEVK